MPKKKTKKVVAPKISNKPLGVTKVHKIDPEVVESEARAPKVVENKNPIRKFGGRGVLLPEIDGKTVRIKFKEETNWIYKTQDVKVADFLIEKGYNEVE